MKVSELIGKTIARIERDKKYPWFVILIDTEGREFLQIDFSRTSFTTYDGDGNHLEDDIV